MSHTPSQHDDKQVDPMDSIIHSIPVVIPTAGALMIFLLAFIAVFVG